MQITQFLKWLPRVSVFAINSSLPLKTDVQRIFDNRIFYDIEATL